MKIANRLDFILSSSWTWAKRFKSWILPCYSGLIVKFFFFKSSFPISVYKMMIQIRNHL